MRGSERDEWTRHEKGGGRETDRTANPLHRLTEEERHIAKIAAWVIMIDGDDAADRMFARADALWRADQIEDARLWQRVAEVCFACLHAERRD